MLDITRTSDRRSNRSARALCAAMALVTFALLNTARGDPGDIFTTSAPVIGAEAPKAMPLAAGDASVSEQTGAFQYSYPIKAPPGRNGIKPNLALSYSSQAPIYGGIAAGWSLPIPIITLDTTDGRLWATATQPSIKTYTSSMAGGRPLVLVQESEVVTTYRAQNDGNYVRYELMAPGSGFAWRAYGHDGTIYYFGDNDSKSRSRMRRHNIGRVRAANSSERLVRQSNGLSILRWPRRRLPDCSDHMGPERRGWHRLVCEHDLQLCHLATRLRGNPGRIADELPNRDKDRDGSQPIRLDHDLRLSDPG